MEKLAWSCLLLFTLFGQLWSIPRTSEERPAWSPGLGPSGSSTRGHVQEAPYGSFSRNMLLRRLWEDALKQYKERRNLSQCFWKYCV